MSRATCVFNFPVKIVSTVVVFLPLFGLAFAVIWSILFDFEHSTSTHCKVKNFLPSVSAAISLTPQAYVWRACIALHTTPRYLICYGYWIWYSYQAIDESKKFSSLRGFLTVLTVCANYIELSALLGLTLISSSENFAAHEACFVLFMLGSLVCMITALMLSSISTKEYQHEKRAAKRKALAVTINVSTFLMCLYFYYRHNTFCEPGVYSMFALCEYIVIISNMAFHYTVALDFEDYSFCIVDSSEGKLR